MTPEDWIKGQAPAAAPATPSALDAWIAGGGAPAAAPAPAASGASPAPDQEQGGFLHNLGLGTRAALQGLGSIPAMAYDVAAAPQNLLNAGVKAATGTDLGLSTRSGGEQVSRLLDAAGLPQPRSSGERMAGKIIEGMGGALPTMGAGAMMQGARAASPMAQRLAAMLTADPAIQVAAGAGSGAASGAAEEGGAGPVGQMAAGLAGGVGGAGLAHAGAMAGNAARGVLAPWTQGGREAIVADTMLRQSSDPASVLARLRASRLDPSIRLPDSPVTTAQAAADPGLNMLESGLRSDAISPGPGVPSPAAQFAGVDQARNTARAAELPPPAPEAAGVQGAGLRQGVQDADTTRTAARKAAFAAVDPDGTSRVPIHGVRQAVDDLTTQYYGELSGGLPRELQAIRDDMQGGMEVSYQATQNLRSRVVALQDKFSGDSRAQGFLLGVKGAVDQAVERAAQPRQPYSIPASAADVAAQDAAEGAAQRPDVDYLTQPRVAGQRPASNGKSLAQWLVESGGIRPDGDVRQILDGARMRPGLMSNRGMALDEAAARARDAGYFPEVVENRNQPSMLDSNHLLNALDDEFRGRPRYPGGAGGGNGAVRAAASDLDRELDTRGTALSSTSDRGDVLRAVRDPGFGEAPGAPAPDGYQPLPDAMSPDQVARLRAAQDQARRDGRDFGRDETGTGAVAEILRRGEGGGFQAPNATVLSHALSGPDAARQVLRAGGDGVRPQLQQAFMDRAWGATASVTPAANGQPVMSGPGFLKYWRQNGDTARALFDPQQVQRMELLASDFGETASAQAMSRARGSDTGRNLSVANLISQVSRGLVDPGNPAAQSILRPVGWLMKLPEGGVRELLTQAMKDPALADQLLAKASPEAVERATGYIRQTMGQRFGQAATDAAGRTAVRTAQAGEDAQDRRTPDERRRAALAARLSR